MADIKYVDYSALSYYDGKLKAFLATKDAEVLARSAVTITKLTTPTSGSAATYSVKQNYTTSEGVNTAVEIGKIEIPLDKFVSAGSVVDHSFVEGQAAKKAIELTVTNGDKVYIDISGIAGDISALDERLDALEALHVKEGDDFKTVAEEITDAIEALDTTADVTIATVSAGVVTLKAGVAEEDGVIKQGSGDDIVLAKVATTGKSEDVSVEAKSADASEGQAAWSLADATVQAALETLTKAEANDKAAINKLNGAVDADGSVLKMIHDNAKDAKYGTKTVEGEEVEISIEQAIKDAENAAKTAGVVTVEKQETAETGYASTYVVKQAGTQVGAKINIPKDYLVKSGTLETCTKADTPVAGLKVGDKYLDFVVNTVGDDETAQHIYLPVNDLFDSYTSGSVATDAIVITVDNTSNTISASITDGTISRDKVDADFEADLAAIESAIGVVTVGETESLYAVADRIKAEAKDGIYKAAEGTVGEAGYKAPVTIGEAIAELEGNFNSLTPVTNDEVDALF